MSPSWRSKLGFAASPLTRTSADLCAAATRDRGKPLMRAITASVR